MTDNPTMHVQVVSPEQVLYEGEAEMVVCKTRDGEIAFLPEHAPLLGSLGVAKVRALLPDGGEHVVAVHGGFVEVSNNKVIILSDVAELPEQIDISRAEAAKQRAERDLNADADDELAMGALARSALRIEVAGERQPAR